MSVRESTLEEGDQVLVRNVRLWNKDKLADKWESTVYKVHKKIGDLPMYTIQPIYGVPPELYIGTSYFLAVTYQKWRKLNRMSPRSAGQEPEVFNHSI